MIIKELIEIIMAVIMILVIVGVLARAIFYKQGLGTKVIQFTSISLLIPALLILAIEGVLSAETIGVLLAGLSGYILAGIGGADKSLKDKEE
ncbi:MAG: hypothetical protein ACRC9X_03025 [Bacteroidales bacterium]